LTPHTNVNRGDVYGASCCHKVNSFTINHSRKMFNSLMFAPENGITVITNHAH